MTPNPTHKCRQCGYDVLARADDSNPYQRCPNCQGSAWRFVSGGALAESADAARLIVRKETSNGTE